MMLEEKRKYVISLVEEHKYGLLLIWLTLNLLSYLTVRVFKNFPMRIMLHRIFSVLSYLSASIFAISLNIESNLFFQ